jgi:hypothetical protein
MNHLSETSTGETCGAGGADFTAQDEKRELGLTWQSFGATGGALRTPALAGIPFRHEY